ncbi:MAG TPA: hypothetical protein DCP69_01520 [Candidatus Omnitrophica bacterium]|nr:hypothetical protein [Candidatus Omnitrophota bacterium]
MDKRYLLTDGNVLHVAAVDEGGKVLTSEGDNIDDTTGYRLLHLGEEDDTMERCGRCFPVVFADGDTGNETESD